MAVAIPLLVGAGATAAGLTATTATMMAVGASLAANATGISAKVDRAAAKVFGRDAVKAFNIAGTVYGAFGGFSGASPGQVFDNVGNAFGGAAGSTGAGASVSMGESAGVDGMSGMDMAADGMSATDPSSMGAVNGMDAQSDAFGQGGALSAARAPAAMQPGAQPGVQTPGMQPAQTPTTQSSFSKMWESLGPQGKAMAINMVGQTVGGIAQGKAREEELAREDAIRRDRNKVLGVRYGRPDPGVLASFNGYYAGKGQ